MTVRDGFGIFILSHGRADFLNGNTCRSLRTGNYSGPWWIVLDDEDQTRAEYEDMFGADRIVTFHKDDADTDMADNGGHTAASVYARNAVDKIAADLGLTWTLTLDDDYHTLSHRFIDSGMLRGCITRRLDEVIEMHLDFLEESGAWTVAWAQGGDYIGGVDGIAKTMPVKRKAMNSFFCRVGDSPRFIGRLNEDVNAYVYYGSQGRLFLTTLQFGLVQVPTQQAEGGVGDAYKAIGTYVKSFYTILFVPSAVRISVIGNRYDRIHHHVMWNNTVPKIMSETHRRNDLVEPAMTWDDIDSKINNPNMEVTA